MALSAIAHGPPPTRGLKRVVEQEAARTRLTPMGKKTNGKTEVPALAKGQLWKLSHAYIQIVELGKRLIHYKMMTQPGETRVRTQMSGIETMMAYLKSRRAQLVSE